MKECKISISKRMQYCIIFFFLLKPDYFSFLGIFTILYNYTFLIILFCVLINEIRKLLWQRRLQGCTRVSGEWRQVLHGWLCAEEHAV